MKKMTDREIIELLEWSAFINIPSCCYTITPENPDSIDYEVYYKGKKIDDAYGVIRYSGDILKRCEPDDDSGWDGYEEASIDWKKELGE